MKSKGFDVLMLLTSLLVYLEWGGNHHSFLYQAEAEILHKIWFNPVAVWHPLTVMPMLSQLSLAINLVLKQPNRPLVIVGISGLSMLVYFIFFIGILSVNLKIIYSTIPFLVVSMLAIRHYRMLFRKTKPSGD